MSYHNCSCPEPEPRHSDHHTDESPISPRDGCHDNAHVTSCQSLPISFIRGMQNSCDVCRECCEARSCVRNSFPLRTFSVLRGFALPRNSCRSLRRNSYQEKNALSVCCFDNQVPRLHSLVNFGKSSGEFKY